jgi:hypothetical protein
MSNTVDSIEELKELWALLFPGEPVPDGSQWALWFLRHPASIVRQSVVELATKYRKLSGRMDGVYMAKFASAVMNRLSREAKEQRTATAH